jgi:hypothetical protein
VAFLKVCLFDLVLPLVGVDGFSEQTPNFAMDTTDVDLNADRAQERFTNHLFDQSLEYAGVVGRSGSAIQVPSDMSMWPPAVLFDAIYASAVVHHFGLAMTDILKRWEDMFYPGGAMKAAHTDDKHRGDHADADKTLRQQQPYKRRNGRRSVHGAIHPHDVVMMYRFKAMEPEKVRAYLNGCEEMAAEAEHKGLEEKVNSWREAVIGTP